WHGASLNFVFWGLLHGIALVAERMFGRSVSPETAKAVPQAAADSLPRARGRAGEGAHFGQSARTTLAWLLTFHFICLTWIFFRSPSLEATQIYFATLAWGETGWSTTMTPLVAAMLVIGAATQLVPNRWFEALESWYDGAALPFQVALPFAVIFLIAVAAPGGVPPFIYFQF